MRGNDEEKEGEYIPAGRFPHAHESPAIALFSVAARSQLQAPAGRAPIWFSYQFRVLYVALLDKMKERSLSSSSQDRCNQREATQPSN